jgi:hypothetical protein
MLIRAMALSLGGKGGKRKERKEVCERENRGERRKDKKVVECPSSL